MKEEKKDLFPACIPEIEKIIGYTFRDKSLITQAFTRTSFCNERGGGYQSNEVLEFIGDSVLSVAIITFLTEMHAERYEHGIRTVFGEGDFSNIKSRLSDKKNLSECITAIGLEKYLRLGEGDKKLGIEREPSVKEDLFESIIGATYIDCERDIATVMTVVSRMLDVSAYAVKTPPTQSSKNALQEFCADKKRRLPQPIYKTLGDEGPDHKKVYERGVYVGERLVASAKGKNLKIADAGAAEAALKILLSEEEAARESAAAVSKTATTEPINAEGKKKVKKRPEKKLKPSSTVADGNKMQTKVDNSNNAAVTAAKPANASASVAKAAKATTENATRGGTSSAVRLKSHATRVKVATPTFKDLGEVRQGGKSVYRVECIFMGKSLVGEGESRPEAKENAASAMLASVKSEAKPKQQSKPKQEAKPTQQQKPKQQAKPKQSSKSSQASKPKQEAKPAQQQKPKQVAKAKGLREKRKKK